MAILWHEMWHEGLEEASRLYFGERNVKGMFAVLEPLHAMMERGPQTLKETSFNQVRGREGTLTHSTERPLGADLRSGARRGLFFCCCAFPENAKPQTCGALIACLIARKPN